jgi:chaperonin GroES
MKIRPLFARVLIRKQGAETETKGGILLPDRAQKNYPIGEVLSVGPGKKDAHMAVKVGDVVWFNDYGHAPVPGEKDLVMIDQDNILGVIE